MKIFFLCMKNEHTRHSLTPSWLLVSRLYNKKLVSRIDLSRRFCFIKTTNNSCRARQKREKNQQKNKGRKKKKEKKTKKVKKKAWWGRSPSLRSHCFVTLSTCFHIAIISKKIN